MEVKRRKGKGVERGFTAVPGTGSWLNHPVGSLKPWLKQHCTVALPFGVVRPFRADEWNGSAACGTVGNIEEKFVDLGAQMIPEI